jgi:hypothetical protein
MFIPFNPIIAFENAMSRFHKGNSNGWRLVFVFILIIIFNVTAGLASLCLLIWVVVTILRVMGVLG